MMVEVYNGVAVKYWWGLGKIEGTIFLTKEGVDFF